MKKEDEKGSRPGRKPWLPMELRPEGRLSEIVAGGGGKLSTAGGDPGEARKPAGSG